MVESTQNPPARLPRFTLDGEELVSRAHGREIRQVMDVLERHYEGARVLVTTGQDVPIAASRHDLRDVVKPDVWVALGVPSRMSLDLYRPWKEGKVPDWVLEVASESTADLDRGPKLEKYHRLGIPEVVLCDPEWLCHDHVLQVFRHEPEGYRCIGELEEGRIPSPALGLDLESRPYELENERYWTLRFVDPRTGLVLLSDKEVADQLTRENEELRRRLGEK